MTLNSETLPASTLHLPTLNLTRFFPAVRMTNSHPAPHGRDSGQSPQPSTFTLLLQKDPIHHPPDHKIDKQPDDIIGGGNKGSGGKCRVNFELIKDKGNKSAEY